MKKTLSLLFILLLVMAGCASSKSTLKSQDVKVEYNAMTRGSSIKVSVDKDTVLSLATGRKKVSSLSTIDQQDWNDLLAALEKVELSKIETLKSPTNKRHYDGALFADLTVTVGDKTYKSSGFDHGNPPQEIKEVVDKVLALSGLGKEENED